MKQLLLMLLVLAFPNAVAGAFIASWQAGVMTLTLMTLAIGSLTLSMTWEKLLRWYTRRCECHNRVFYGRIARLEHELGLPASEPPSDLVARYADHALTDCGHAWCRSQ